ncbi:MAG: NAD(P)/FAD-dependent oxidoreductase, partial [Chitinophagaceae bacterium]|nr:NAD(P)/FAD-dependent oxidoreductase [Chitinophagaceae bacterium]
MNPSSLYDVAIVGGGVAGLCLSIQLARENYKVILFEKEKYPFHKVCGEYVSMESWNFLESLGVPLSEWKLPHIRRLLLSSPSGLSSGHDLPLGGFGVSRYTLDNYLAKLARASGVELRESTKVDHVEFAQDTFHVYSGSAKYSARLTCGAFGKRSNLDVKLKRGFVQKKPGKLNNYIAVKYHIRANLPSDQIALHNFENGYSGISQVEDNKYCLCYMTTAANLQNCNNQITQLEKNIVRQNPFLNSIFEEAVFLYDTPVTIAQISFDKKSPLENHLLMSGDAAGMVTPLCGNGMSMAMHGSKIAYIEIDRYLQGKITRFEMESAYQDKWNNTFHARMVAGRSIQKLFGKRRVTDVFLRTMKILPGVATSLIKKT